MPGHVTVRSETGVLERNIGFGAKGWITDWRLQGIWRLTRFESHGPKMRKLNLGFNEARGYSESARHFSNWLCMRP
jgi:hypothetical protein